MADKETNITPHGLAAFANDRVVIDRLLVALNEADRVVLWDVYGSGVSLDAQVCNLIGSLVELLERNPELK